MWISVLETDIAGQQRFDVFDGRRAREFREHLA
ncbi:MAG: hypothetical protein ACI915_005323, partial [Gammaproteobacteria bacterium]